jgi:site-specific recombinase XerD
VAGPQRRRNAAFTGLLFSSGLRLREGGCLLTMEVPDAVAGLGYHEGSVAGAVAKRRERMFYASAAALRRVAGYIATTRAEAIRRARRHHRYEQNPGKLIVTKVGHGARRKLCWRDEQGRTGEAPVGAVGPGRADAPVHRDRAWPGAIVAVANRGRYADGV